MSVVQTSSELAAQTVWPVDRIKDHVRKIGSGVTPSGGAASYLDAGIPLLRSQNVHFDGLRMDDVAFIAEETHEEMAGTKLRERDVLLNITGASIGRCSFVPDGFGEGNVNQHVCIIRPTSKLDYKFLTYCLSAPWGQDQIFSSFTGASRQGLGQRDLGDIQVPLPPLPEQQRIAAYLDASCAAIDAAVVAKRRQLETLDALRKSTISRAVMYGIAAQPTLRRVEQDWLREIPSHWEVCRLKRVLARMDYGISESTIEEGRYPVLKMGHLSDGEITFSNLDFVDEVPVDLLLETGDLLYNRTNSPDQVGKAAVFRKSRADEVTFASYLVRLRVNHRANPWFLNYVLNSDGFLGFARRLAIPSVQQSNLNSTRYSRMFIPLPPIEEQEAVRAHLDAKLTELKQIVTSIEAQIATLTAYRKSLIHECVTGQRRVTEADVARVRRGESELHEVMGRVEQASSLLQSTG
jgi:type I restriction enzyme S subunit